MSVKEFRKSVNILSKLRQKLVAFFSRTTLYVCIRETGASESAYMRRFSLNKTSGHLQLSHALSLSTTRSVNLVVKATDDCWSGYWEMPAGHHQVTWSPRDPSLLLVRVIVVMATRFAVTSLYAGVVTQAQAGHDVIKLAVRTFFTYLLHSDHCLCPYTQQESCRNDC